MTYGVTSTGFKAKRYEDIFEDIKTRFKTDLGIDLDRNPDMVAKFISNIIALPIAQSWSNTQTLQSMFDVDKAEGVWLENLASFYGITRSSGSYSRGRQSVTASSFVTIPAGETFSNSNGDTFNNESPIEVNSSSATRVVLRTPDYDGTQPMTVSINNRSFIEYGDDATETVAALVTLINSEGDSGVIASSYIEDNFVYLDLVTDEDYKKSSFGAGSNFSTTQIEGYGEIKASELGDYTYAAGTVTQYPDYTGIITSVNQEPITGGSGIESDAELRARIKSTRNTGKATIGAIKSALLSLDGVTSVSVLENDTMVDEGSTGIPAKAFKCIVKGGSQEDIGQTIFDTKPAGISTAGDEFEIVTDVDGEEHTVYFSRIANRYIHVKVEYSLYEEETSPTDVAEAIANQVLSFGEALDVGVDVIQGRIAASIYQNISGLEVVKVSVGATVSAFDPAPPLSYENAIGISLSEEAAFSLDRIAVVQL